MMTKTTGILGLIFLLGFSLYDKELTLSLMDNPWPDFSFFVKRSVFYGQGIGASDIGVFLWVLSLVIYLSALQRPSLWRLCFGYVVAVGVFYGVLIVHPLKLILGRARPYLVVQGADYSEWYGLGPHHPLLGFYSGSFPSGHVATVIPLLACGYFLWRASSGSKKTAGGLLMLVALVGGLLIGVGRSMSGEHWLSDSLGSLYLGALATVFCFNFLKVKERIDGAKLPFDGFVHLSYLGALILGITILFLGLRSIGVWASL